MRKEKALIGLLEDFVRLVGAEADRNPEFGEKLEALLHAIPERARSSKPRVRSPKRDDLPDVHAEFNSRGPSEFQLWLRDLPIATLRALIRAHDLDATRRTSKWKDAERLSTFIADQIGARLSRGSGFLSMKDE